MLLPEGTSCGTRQRDPAPMQHPELRVRLPIVWPSARPSQRQGSLQSRVLGIPTGGCVYRDGYSTRDRIKIERSYNETQLPGGRSPCHFPALLVPKAHFYLVMLIRFVFAFSSPIAVASSQRGGGGDGFGHGSQGSGHGSQGSGHGPPGNLHGSPNGPGEGPPRVPIDPCSSVGIRP